MFFHRIRNRVDRSVKRMITVTVPIGRGRTREVKIHISGDTKRIEGYDCTDIMLGIETEEDVLIAMATMDEGP